MSKNNKYLVECQISSFRKLYPYIDSYYHLSDEEIIRLYRCTTFYYLWLADVLLNAIESFCPSKYRKCLTDFVSDFLLHGEVLPF